MSHVVSISKESDEVKSCEEICSYKERKTTECVCVCLNSTGTK